MPKHPTQKIVVADDQMVRFQENPIVRYLLDNGGLTMTDLARLDFSNADRRQFAQLIGYSVRGYGELRCAEGHKSVRKADKVAALYS
jgi:hypothetical protein